MRASALVFAGAGFGVACLLVIVGGRTLGVLDVPSVKATNAHTATVEAGEQPAAKSVAEAERTPTKPQMPDAEAAEPPAAKSVSEAEETKPQMPHAAPARAIASDIVVPPSIGKGAQLLREPPRAPLSELSLALPPKLEMPDEWDGTALFQPVAPASGLIEAKGFRVAVAGVVPIDPQESCASGGERWNCGIRARTAFRAFLRGRAVVCALPPEADRTVTVAKCRVAKQDVGYWLVANGWARAAENGPYADTGEKARTEGKGIFGPPPAPAE